MNFNPDHDQNTESSTKTTVNVLWTGGFDSTYRIVELSRLNVVVQPYYLLDEKRRS